MSQVDHIDDIDFSTAFEVDKIFPTKFSGSFSVSGSSSPASAPNIVTSTITNPYGEDVLPVMQFSTDGSTWYDGGSMKYVSGTTLADLDFSATCYTTSTSIVVVAGNYNGSSQTCNYRILLVSDD
jgi:hypothetical protein